MDSYRKILTDLAGKILDDSGRSEAELSILITDDEEIRSLNHIYRAMDRPTDVLSFSQLEGEGPASVPQLLGDVVISWETAQRQASELGHPILVEMERLLVHGLLHLLGFDHEKNDEAARIMREEEEKYAPPEQNAVRSTQNAE
jgi:probable rRNA maturation factor